MLPSRRDERNSYRNLGNLTLRVPSRLKGRYYPIISRLMSRGYGGGRYNPNPTLLEAQNFKPLRYGVREIDIAQFLL